MTKKSKPDVWFPVYIGDYLGDTTDFEIEHHGAYYLLLMTQWRIGYIPDEPRRQAAICKVSLARWKHIAPRVIQKFTVVDGRLVQKRLAKEREKAFRNFGESARKIHTDSRESSGGDIGGSLPQKQQHGSSEPGSKAVVIGSNTSPPSPSPSSLPQERKKKGSLRSPSASPDDLDFQRFWKAYPKPSARPKVLEIWPRIMTETTIDVLLAAIASTSWNFREKGRFIPLPTTWLNQQRWLDMPIACVEETSLAEQLYNARPKQVDDRSDSDNTPTISGEAVEIENA